MLGNEMMGHETKRLLFDEIVRPLVKARECGRNDHTHSNE